MNTKIKLRTKGSSKYAKETLVHLNLFARLPLGLEDFVFVYIGPVELCEAYVEVHKTLRKYTRPTIFTYGENRYAVVAKTRFNRISYIKGILSQSEWDVVASYLSANQHIDIDS